MRTVFYHQSFFYVVKLLEDILLYLNTHQALDFVYQVTSYLCVN